MMIELVAGLLMVSPLVASGAAAAIGVALIRRPTRSPAFLAFFVSSLLVAAWLGVSVLSREADTPQLAERWAAVGLGVAALLPPAVHRIAATFGEIRPARRWRSRVGWLPAIPFVALALGDRLVTSVETGPWGFQPRYGELIWPYLGVWLGLWLLSLYELRVVARELGPRSRKPVRWLAVAVTVAGAAGADLLPGLGSFPGLGSLPEPVSSIPPVGALPLFAFVALGAVAFRPSGPEIPPRMAQGILATLVDGALVCDARGRIELVNEAFCSLAGRSRRQLVGRPVEDLFSSAQEEGFPDGDWKESAVREQPATLSTAEGDSVEVRVSTSPLRNDDGMGEWTVVLVKDLRGSRRQQLRLERSEQRLEEVQRLTRCAHWRWVVGSENVSGSPELLRIFGLPEEMGGARWQRFFRRFDAGDRRHLRACLEDALRNHTTFRTEGRIRGAGGEWLSLHVQGEIDSGDDGASFALAGTVQDVSERRAAEARFESLLESAPDPMVIVDPEGIITRINRRLESAFGYRREELVGQPVEILIPEEQRREHARLRSGYTADPTPRPMGAGLELCGRRKDGSRFPVDISLAPSPDHGGRLVTAAIRDISDRKRLEEELTRTAFHDSLTGLPNRALLMNRLRHAINRAEQGGDPPFALLCIGLDRLEDVTSSLGHEAGDELVVTCTERLQQFELAGDTIARLRDDAFVIFQDRLGGVADATRLADRILEELARRIEVGGQEVFVGASIGIALSTTGHRRAEELLRDAETAMHRARRRGQRSYEIFDPKMHREAAVQLELGMDLQRAVETDQLFLEYQPILSVSSGEILGAEALVRWRHPKQGLIGPSDLIPLAEETGCIVAIGDWVLSAACRQSLSWQSTGRRPVFVAVNLSATQLRQREFPAMVRGVLRETGLDPAFLHLELTETLLVENSDLAVDALAALRATGAGLCVDDFGVGHSSLSYLQHLPIHTLKIDRSFVRPIGREPRSDSLMAAIIRIAHSLELKTIAEGVESEEQLDSLRSFACDQYQGYFYSPPLPEGNFTQLLQSAATR